MANKVIEVREQSRQDSGEEGQEKGAAWVMIVSKPTNKDLRSGKRKQEVEEGSPSTDVVLGANLKKTPPMLLVRWKTVAHRDNSASTNLVEVKADMEDVPGP